MTAKLSPTGDSLRTWHVRTDEPANCSITTMNMQRNFTYYSDPGHGWVQVHKAFLEQLVGFDWRIVFSSFSYYSRRDGFVYLEEDSDAAKFIGLCLANSIEPTFSKQFFNTECFIRSLSPL